MFGRILRITMFKIASKEHQSQMNELYKKLSATNSKDGKPYILSLQAGPAYEDARSKGYTFVSRSEFASKADMDYYNVECEAHKELKAAAKDFMSEPPLTVYYEPAVIRP